MTAPAPAGTHVIAEPRGNSARELVTVTGGTYPAATVMGCIARTGKYTALSPSASDGSEVASAILWGAGDASSGDVAQIATVSDADVDGAALVWPAGITADQKAAAIAALARVRIHVLD